MAFMQTVTCTTVKSGYESLNEVHAPLQKHIEGMTAEGWRIVSTESGSNASWTHVLVFWQKDG